MLRIWGLWSLVAFVCKQFRVLLIQTTILCGLAGHSHHQQTRYLTHLISLLEEEKEGHLRELERCYAMSKGKTVFQ